MAASPPLNPWLTGEKMVVKPLGMGGGPLIINPQKNTPPKKWVCIGSSLIPHPHFSRAPTIRVEKKKQLGYNIPPSQGYRWKGKSSSKPSFSGSMLIFQGVFRYSPFSWSGTGVFVHKQFFLILLMVQKSGDHQLRLVVYPIIYRVFLHARWLGMGFLNHQQYMHISLQLQPQACLQSQNPQPNDDDAFRKQVKPSPNKKHMENIEWFLGTPHTCVMFFFQNAHIFRESWWI